jgi:hypothetical protein
MRASRREGALYLNDDAATQTDPVQRLFAGDVASVRRNPLIVSNSIQRMPQMRIERAMLQA